MHVSINRFGEDSDGFAVRYLVRDAELANIDPRATGTYLIKVGFPDARCVDVALAQLERPESDREDGLRLHLMRALANRELGEPEGKLFRGIALDAGRRPPLRAWAMKAWERTPDYRASEVIEVADAEPDALLRRAAITTLRSRPSEQRDHFLLHAEERYPDLRYTRRWVEAA